MGSPSTYPTHFPVRPMTRPRSPKLSSRRSFEIPAARLATKATKGTSMLRRERNRKEGSSANGTRNATRRSPHSGRPSNESSRISSRGGSSTPTTGAHILPTVTPTTPLADCSSFQSHGVMNNTHSRQTCPAYPSKYWKGSARRHHLVGLH